MLGKDATYEETVANKCGVYTLKGLWRSLHIHWVVPSDRPCGGVGVSRTAESTRVQIFPPLSDDGCVHSVLILLILVEEENPLKSG